MIQLKSTIDLLFPSQVVHIGSDAYLFFGINHTSYIVSWEQVMGPPSQVNPLLGVDLLARELYYLYGSYITFKGEPMTWRNGHAGLGP